MSSIFRSSVISHIGAIALGWVIVSYDIVAKNAERLHGIPWSGVVLDEAHFIKNNIQRASSECKSPLRPEIGAVILSSHSLPSAVMGR